MPCNVFLSRKGNYIYILSLTFVGILKHGRMSDSSPKVISYEQFFSKAIKLSSGSDDLSMSVYEILHGLQFGQLMNQFEIN